MAQARTNANVRGKEILLLIEKVAASGTFVPYGCLSAANFTNPGVEIEEIACRAGVFREPSGDAGLPTIALESIYRRILVSGDVANNVTDDEIMGWVTSGETKNVKLLFGNKVGDTVLTGPGFFNQQSINGPQTGIATGGVTFNFSEQPTKTATAA